MTCAQLQAHDRFTREREDWNREYRKVMARKVRGTVSEEEFRAWKAESGLENWTAFDEWRARGGIRARETQILAVAVEYDLIAANPAAGKRRRLKSTRRRGRRRPRLHLGADRP